MMQQRVHAHEVLICGAFCRAHRSSQHDTVSHSTGLLSIARVRVQRRTAVLCTLWTGAHATCCAAASRGCVMPATLQRYVQGLMLAGNRFDAHRRDYSACVRG